MDFLAIFIVLLVHTVFDWWLQTRWQAENKSKDWWALGSHVAIYTFGLLFAGVFIFKGDAVPAAIWLTINSIMHFITDVITSRLNAKFYPRKAFWNCIGTDQLVHYLTLFGTYFLLSK